MDTSLKNIKKVGKLITLSLVLTLAINSAYSDSFTAPNTYYDDLFGSTESISVATGTKQPRRTTPAVTSVITAQEISRLPATNLGEVLETIPGFFISRTLTAYLPLYRLNGLHDQNNTTILILIDGIRSAPTATGYPYVIISEINIHDIERIEILRGPSSALYGADAFAGVINIVTKGGESVKNKDMGAEISNYKDGKVWGHTYSKSEYGLLNFSFQLSSENNEDIFIAKDAQTNFDNILSTSASLAPNDVDFSYKSTSIQLDWQHNNYSSQIRWQSQIERHLGMSTNEAIIPNDNTIESQWLETSVRHEKNFLQDTLTIKAHIGFSYMRNNKGSGSGNHLIYPAGAFSGLFPDGVIQEQWNEEYYFQSNLRVIYRKLNHRLTFGIGFNSLSILDITDKRNYKINDQGTIQPLPTITDLSSEVKASLDQDRDNVYSLIQDEWNISREFDLLLGLRIDKYSTFGEFISPRFGTVWHMDYNKTIKILFGRGYRVPTHFDLYTPASAVITGNINLKPQSIDMAQAYYLHYYKNDTTINYGAYYYEINKLIDLQQEKTLSPFNRSDTITGHGYQLEVNKQSRYLDTYFNYSYQKTTSTIPKHMAYLNLTTKIVRKWSATLQLNYYGDTNLKPRYVKEKNNGYTMTDIRITHHIISNSVVELIVKNVANSDARVPGLLPGTSVPDFIPLNQRTFILRGAFQFK